MILPDAAYTSMICPGINRIVLLCAILLFVMAKGVTGQYGNEVYFSDTHINPDDSSHLFFRLNNSSFVNNREFFNPYQPGYTLIGYYLRPALEYHPGRYTRIRAGMHLLQYSGMDSYSQAVPLFSFHHRFFPGLEMVFGSLYGTLNHNLIEPLFAFDRFFTHHNESGLQFLVDHDYIKADIWINWEQFIFTGDPFREEFVAGVSSQIPITGGQGKVRVEIPFQLLVNHRGGQIDASEERMQNLVNFAAGVHADLDIDHPVFKSVGFRGYLAGFRDLSSELRYFWDNGRGIYPNLLVSTRWFDAGIGYWSGKRFVAPRGEPVFQSVSAVDPLFAKEYREMMTSKVIYNRRLIQGIDMALRFEVYYDLQSAQFDHSGGLHILIDQRFFVSGLQGR